MVPQQLTSGTWMLYTAPRIYPKLGLLGLKTQGRGSGLAVQTTSFDYCVHLLQQVYFHPGIFL